MATRALRYLPDEILHKTSRQIEKIDDRIKILLDDMLDTMRVAEGLGISAVQVGVLRRAVIIDVGNGPMKMINPKIIAKEGEEEDIEGCLSVPGYQGFVTRPVSVTVSYTDENGEEKLIENAQGLLKKALCHELDHLDGIVYTDIARSVYALTDEDDNAGEEGEKEQANEEE